MNFTDFQRQYYKKQASHFDKKGLYNRQNRNHYKKVLKVIGVVEKEKPKEVLEIGVGTGIHAKWLIDNTKLDFNYVGVDISKEMLKVAENRLDSHIKDGSVRLIAANGLDLPFKDNSYDMVFCAATLHHTNKQRKFIKEMVRVLKPRGKLLMVEPNPLFPTNLWTVLTNPAESQMIKMSESNFYKWTDQSLREVEVERFLYTPPFPKNFSTIYDFLDNLLAKIPIVNLFSIMFFVVGEKK